jgi:hypothetical protein
MFTRVCVYRSSSDSAKHIPSSAPQSVSFPGTTRHISRTNPALLDQCRVIVGAWPGGKIASKARFNIDFQKESRWSVPQALPPDYFIQNQVRAATRASMRRHVGIQLFTKIILINNLIVSNHKWTYFDLFHPIKHYFIPWNFDKFMVLSHRFYGSWF